MKQILKLWFNRTELAGSVGDLGTLVPLVVALITLNHLHPVPVLLLTGLFYVATGLYYGLPIPVQPLKALAATAIAMGLGARTISTAGFLIGVVLLALGMSGLSQSASRLFTRPLVRGIQLGIGLILMRTALKLIMTKGPLLSGTGWLEANLGIAVAAAAGLLIAIFLPSRKLPAGLVVVVFGVGVGAAFGGLAPTAHAAPIPSGILGWGIPGLSEVTQALALLVLPQLPLTFANSVVATADTARKYFDAEKARRVTPRALSAGLGLANVLSAVAGGIPVCHGAGGLTAHYRFGARTGGAPVILGVSLVTLALVFGRNSASVLALVPLPVLGVILGYAGLQHALLARDLSGYKDALVAGTTGLFALATGNIAIGLAAGAALSLAYRLQPLLVKTS
ncbi:MAG: sulfate permease [Firmicutes bacterium]|nr:sulfate permease [Bacillota bacterium]